MSATNPYREKLEQWAKITFDTSEKEKKKQKQKQMERQYKVMKLNELAAHLNLPSSKGHKTTDYLEFVINEIEKTGYIFVQFLQLIDVLYVIIDTSGKVRQVNLPMEKFRPTEEINDHYNPPQPAKKETVAEPHENFEKAIEAVKSRDHLDKNMRGAKLPWKK